MTWIIFWGFPYSLIQAQIVWRRLLSGSTIQDPQIWKGWIRIQGSNQPAGSGSKDPQIWKGGIRIQRNIFMNFSSIIVIILISSIQDLRSRDPQVGSGSTDPGSRDPQIWNGWIRIQGSTWIAHPCFKETNTFIVWLLIIDKNCLILSIKRTHFRLKFSANDSR